MSFNDDILARWPILRVQELLSGRSSASQLMTGSVKIWKGRYVVLQCLIHPDSQPSCKFEIDKDYFRCWACGEHGNRLDLIRKVMGFPESTSSAEVIAWLKEAERDPLMTNRSLVPQNAPDPRFADGEWVRLDNEHLAGVYDYVDLDRVLRYQVLRFEGTLDGKPVTVHHLVATIAGADTDLFSGPENQLLQAELPQQGFALVRKGFVLTPPKRPIAPPMQAPPAQ